MGKNLEALKKKCFAYLKENYGEDCTVSYSTKAGEIIDVPVKDLLRDFFNDSEVDDAFASSMLYFEGIAANATETDKSEAAAQIAELSLNDDPFYKADAVFSVEAITLSIAIMRAEHLRGVVFNNCVNTSNGIAQYVKKKKPLTALDYSPNAEPVEVVLRLLNSKNFEKTKKGISTNKESKDPDTKTVIFVEDGDSVRTTLTVENYYSKFLKGVRNGGKVFSFVLQKAMEQHTEKPRFALQELVELGIYSDVVSALRGLRDKIIPKLHGITIHIEPKKRGKAASGFISAPIFGEAYVTAGTDYSFITLPISLCLISQSYYSVIPRWAYSLPDDAFYLLRYLFYLARQRGKDLRENGYFTIKIDTIRERMGLPSPKDERRLGQMIAQPIENALENIETAQKNAGGETVYFEISDHIDSKTFLQSTLRVTLKGSALDFMIEREAQRTKKIAAAKKTAKKKKEVVAIEEQN